MFDLSTLVVVVVTVVAQQQQQLSFVCSVHFAPMSIILFLTVCLLLYTHTHTY